MSRSKSLFHQQTKMKVPTIDLATGEKAPILIITVSRYCFRCGFDPVEQSPIQIFGEKSTRQTRSGTVNLMLMINGMLRYQKIL